MAIVTISRGTFSGGQSLAECVAEELGYRCISREVLVDAAREYGVAEQRLSKALSEKPGILEGMKLERIHYLAYIRAALCKEVKDDRVVYHGHAGHLLLRGVPHVLRVRVIANMEFRIKAAMEAQQLSREEAIHYIRRVDDERTKWTKFLYHEEWSNASLYDIVINLEQISLSGACEIVCLAAGLEEFQVTPESQRSMDDLILSTGVRAAIAADGSVADGGLEIEAEGGVITLGGVVGSLEDADKIRTMVHSMPGVMEVNSRMRVGPLFGMERY